jgi:hypothetical protein
VHDHSGAIHSIESIPKIKVNRISFLGRKLRVFLDQDYAQPDLYHWRGPYGGGAAGVYRRSLQIRDSSGRVICQTNEVEVTLH